MAVAIIDGAADNAEEDDEKDATDDDAAGRAPPKLLRRRARARERCLSFGAGVSPVAPFDPLKISHWPSVGCGAWR